MQIIKMYILTRRLTVVSHLVTTKVTIPHTTIIIFTCYINKIGSLLIMIVMHLVMHNYDSYEVIHLDSRIIG